MVNRDRPPPSIIWWIPTKSVNFPSFVAKNGFFEPKMSSMDKIWSPLTGEREGHEPMAALYGSATVE